MAKTMKANYDGTMAYVECGRFEIAAWLHLEPQVSVFLMWQTGPVRIGVSLIFLTIYIQHDFRRFNP